MEDALAGFEQRRNEASAADYAENLVAARLDPIPHQIHALRAAIRNDREATRRFMLVRNRMIDPPESSNPQELHELLGNARRGHEEAPSGRTAAA